MDHRGHGGRRTERPQRWKAEKRQRINAEVTEVRRGNGGLGGKESDGLINKQGREFKVRRLEVDVVEGMDLG